MMDFYTGLLLIVVVLVLLIAAIATIGISSMPEMRFHVEVYGRRRNLTTITRR